MTDWVGRKVPFEPAANGKVFLAFSTPGRSQFAQIRARGYATWIDELEIGLAAMAAPCSARRATRSPPSRFTGQPHA